MEELKKFAVFKNFTKEELEFFKSFLVTEKLPQDKFIFLENTVGDSIYLIKSGLIHITKKYYNNEYLITEFSEGDFFGDLSFFDEKPRSANAKAITEAELLSLKRENFKKIQADYPILTNKFCQEVMKGISNRLREANDKFANHVKWGLDTKSIESRIRESMLKDIEIKVILNNEVGFVGKIIYFEEAPHGFNGLRLRVKEREYIIPFKSINYIAFRDRYGNF